MVLVEKELNLKEPIAVKWCVAGGREKRRAKHQKGGPQHGQMIQMTDWREWFSVSSFAKVVLGIHIDQRDENSSEARPHETGA